MAEEPFVTLAQFNDGMDAVAAQINRGGITNHIVDAPGKIIAGRSGINILQIQVDGDVYLSMTGPGNAFFLPSREIGEGQIYAKRL